EEEGGAEEEGDREDQGRAEEEGRGEEGCAEEEGGREEGRSEEEGRAAQEGAGEEGLGIVGRVQPGLRRDVLRRRFEEARGRRPLGAPAVSFCVGGIPRAGRA